MTFLLHVSLFGCKKYAFFIFRLCFVFRVSYFGNARPCVLSSPPLRYNFLRVFGFFVRDNKKICLFVSSLLRYCVLFSRNLFLFLSSIVVYFERILVLKLFFLFIPRFCLTLSGC